MSETLPEAQEDTVLADALRAAEVMLGRLGRAGAALAPPAAPVPRDGPRVTPPMPEAVAGGADAAVLAALPFHPAPAWVGATSPLVVAPASRAAVPALPQYGRAAPPPAVVAAAAMAGAAVSLGVSPRSAPVQVAPDLATPAPAFMLPVLLSPLRAAAPPPFLPGEPQPPMAPPFEPRATAAPAAPAPAGGEAAGGASGGDVFLDGMRVGRWLGNHLAASVARPQRGATGFDPRLTPAFPGTLQGPWGWGG